MSVINKMLHDLDLRQGIGAITSQTQDFRTGITSGMPTSDETVRAERRFLVPSLVATIIVLACVAGAWWYQNQNRVPPLKVNLVRNAPVPEIGAPVIVAAQGVAPLALQKMVEPAIASRSLHVTVEPDKAPQKMANVKSPVAARLRIPESGADQAALSLKMDGAFKLVQIPDAVFTPQVASASQPLPGRVLTEAPTIVAGSVSAGIVAVPPSPTRRSPALEALAQTQVLWNSGSHDAAIDFLREALDSAERANPAGKSSGNNVVLASLARELARMELAVGQVSEALEMLTRLEPSLSGFADIWAIRGNAAQRLGRHQESTAAYLMALKLRPNEPRWMLGAAVSLAAQGQTAASAELVEKARMGGVLSPEVTAYLRQLGVAIRER